MKTGLIVGGGGSLGVALARTLKSKQWRVIAAGRSALRLRDELGADFDEVVEVELGEPDAVREAMKRVGPVDAMLYNAGKLSLAPLLDTSPTDFEASWRTNAFGAFLCAREMAAGMTARGAGAMVFLGATASTRGGARSHAFASSKHALRGLANALAKELGPKGVHVAHVVVDGRVWGARTQARFPDASVDQCLDPAAVASTVVHVLEQPRSAWTFELDLRPDVERWS